MLASCGDDGKVKMYVLIIPVAAPRRVAGCPLWNPRFEAELTMPQLVKQSQGPRVAGHVQGMEAAKQLQRVANPRRGLGGPG